MRDQEKLDQAYENAAFIPGAEAFPPRWDRDAAAFRAAQRCDLDIAYGTHPRARYDLFWPAGTPKGLMVFVHGGYWKARDKSDWSHFAQGGIAAGYAVALPSYPLAPEARISEITRHITTVVTAVAEKVAGPIALAGHSAGGHLVARMAMPDVLPPELASRVMSVVPISPVSDLRPLLPLTLNDDLKLDEAEAIAESPVLAQPLSGPKVTVVVGGAERPAFLDQARWLSDAWGAEHIILDKLHHFDVIDGLRDADSKIMRALIC